MLEGIVEPAERVAVFVAVLRNGEVEAVLRLEQHLCGADLQNVEDLARPFAREQQPAQLLKIGRLVLTQHDFEECLRLGRGQRLGICKQCQFPRRGARVGDCRDFLLLEVVGNAVARHLVGRIPARTDGDIQRPGIEHRMRVVPADDRSQLDRGARPIGLVAGGIGTVEEGTVLQIDKAGEHQLGEYRFALRLVLHESEKDAISFEHAAAMHQRHPLVEAVA